MSSYHTDPAVIADGLRRIAADLDVLVGTDLPETSVSLTLQVSSYGKTDAAQEQERVDAVNALMAALTPDTLANGNDSGSLFGTPSTITVVVHGVDVRIFTAVLSQEERSLREENDKLRAELAARDAGEQR